jgi:hypothetical protein
MSQVHISTKASIRLTGGALCSQIRVDHGPFNLLQQFFTKAETAALTRGVYLSFGTLDDLIAINQQNRATWRPLIPLFDVRQGGITPRNCFCILGRDDRGDVVATQAARLYEFKGTSTFGGAAADLSLYYKNTCPPHIRGETCKVTAIAAHRISGRVVFSGAGWYRPDYRGRELGYILPRIARAYAFTRWFSEYTVSLIAEPVWKGGLAHRAGYTNVDWAVEIKKFEIGDLRFAFVWMDTCEMLDDLENFALTFDAKVNRTIEYRRAEHEVVALR